MEVVDGLPNSTNDISQTSETFEQSGMEDDSTQADTAMKFSEGDSEPIATPSAPLQVPLSLHDLETGYTLDELKERCRELGVKIGGKKTELAQRIIDCIVRFPGIINLVDGKLRVNKLHQQEINNKRAPTKEGKCPSPYFVFAT